MVDGDFKLVNLKTKRPDDDVWLRDGGGFVVKNDEYQNHIQISVEPKQAG